MSEILKAPFHLEYLGGDDGDPPQCHVVDANGVIVAWENPSFMVDESEHWRDRAVVEELCRWLNRKAQLESENAALKERVMELEIENLRLLMADVPDSGITITATTYPAPPAGGPECDGCKAMKEADE